MDTFRIWKMVAGLLVMSLGQGLCAEAQTKALPTPPEVWQDFDPDAGDFKEEIITETTRDGIYYRESYISAYVNGQEVRVYCTYSVKEGARNAPGLMNVHGWMGAPGIDESYVKDGWAVMAHDYSGITNRPHYTRYPDALCHGHMDAKKNGCTLIYSKMPDGTFLTDPKQTSHYLWNAIQRRVVSYLAAQREVDPNRIGAKGYSYGGTIMWNLGMDPRIKATVAYFGIGWLEYYRNKGVWMYDNPYHEPEKTPGEELFLAAVAPQAHAPYITAASLWLNGSNDHHGGHERGEQTFKKFRPGVPWDFAIQARGHHNTEKLGDDCKIWLEKYVLGKDHFWPARSASEIKLDGQGVPELRVTPASPEKVTGYQAYYARKNPVSFGRAWHDAEAVRVGDTWIAKMPVLNVDDYVFGFADIHYQGNIVVASDFTAAVPSRLGNAVATDKPSTTLSDGTGAWTNVGPVEGRGGVKGFRVLNNHGTLNEQFSDAKWKAPPYGQLAFQFYCTQPQTLILVINGNFERELEITASDDWQRMVVPAESLLHRQSRQPMGSWSDLKNIQIKPKPGMDITKVVFAQFRWGVIKPALKADRDGRYYLDPKVAGKATSGWRLMIDQAVSGSPISVGGVKYDKGLGVHADSELVFPLEGQFSTFHVVPGPDDAHRGLLEMKILVDGKEVFASGRTSSGDRHPRTPMDIPVSGAKTLTLVVNDGGDGPGGDHASWADAFLIKGSKAEGPGNRLADGK